jgi:hypothetical protein
MTVPGLLTSDRDAGAGAECHAQQGIAELSAVMLRSRPNVLVIGDATDAEDVLAQLRPHLRSPIVSWLPCESAIPPTAPHYTLLIRAVDRLTALQQGHLFDIIEGTAGNVQVISLADAPLYPAVEAQTFLRDLYYRLNMVMVDFDCGQHTVGR